MIVNPFSLPSRLPGESLPWRRCRLERRRVTLADGQRTTLHVAVYDRAAFSARVAVLDQPAPLVRWCRQQGVRHAIVGGFFVRPECVPLGEVWVEGRVHPTVPFDAPWDGIRACVETSAGCPRIARRDELPLEARGDRLQAGPLLVQRGRRAVAAGEDREGFSAGARQFDSDITDGRYPRAALGLDAHRIIALACDGRTDRDAGLTMIELADALIDLGVQDALNLDGGGSASLVYRGRLRNRPREEHGIDLLEGRPVATAVVFEPRA